MPLVVLADAGYGRLTSFRLGLEERVLATVGHAVAQDADAVTVHPPYGGLGPPTLARYRTRPRALHAFAIDLGQARFTAVTWRQGSKGPMPSRFAAIGIRPAGKAALAAAQAAAGRRNYWDGVLPLRTALIEWAAGEPAPTGYWISSLPLETPLPELVRLAKLRLRIEHDYRELKHGLGLDHYEGRGYRGFHHHLTLVTAAQAFLTPRRLHPKAATEHPACTKF